MMVRTGVTIPKCPCTFQVQVSELLQFTRIIANIITRNMHDNNGKLVIEIQTNITKMNDIAASIAIVLQHH